MRVIAVRNVNEAYYRGMRLFWSNSYPILPSRAGDVMECPEPVTTVYDQPHERVLFDQTRDCNPFFHLFESLWMLAGRKDVEFLGQFSKQAAGLIVGESAYGYRWRHFFAFDQLTSLINLFQAEPGTRRGILAMWNAPDDLGAVGKDIPCNTTVKFQIRDGKLDMQVFCRSNDMIWGAYGANAVHFAFLQEYMAAMIGVEMGRYWQISTNYHVYVGEYQKKAKNYIFTSQNHDPYATNEVQPQKLVDDPSTFNEELSTLLNGSVPFIFKNSFLRDTVDPMWAVWKNWKNGDIEVTKHYLNSIKASDWRTACHQWVARRLKKQEAT